MKGTLKAGLSLFAAAGFTLSLISGASASAFSDGDEAVEYRQQALQLVRENFSFMASMVRGEIEFDGEVFERRATALHHLSHIPWDGFRDAGENHQGSGDALPAVWENWDDFESRYTQFQEDAKNLAEVATSHDVGTIRSAFMATAGNCRQCHDRYRD